MKQSLTDITVLLDRSGSMHSVMDDTIGGVNAFLDEQQKGVGSALVTLLQFDDQYERVYAGIPVAEAPRLSVVDGIGTPARVRYLPRGNTALLDALCRAIDETGARLEGIPEAERPGLVIFVVMTDGLENASKTRTVEDVEKRIVTQRDQFNWQFVFLAANQDAIATAAKFGINQKQALTYAHTGTGVAAALRATSQNVNSARGQAISGQAVSMAYSPEQRKTAVDSK